MNRFFQNICLLILLLCSSAAQAQNRWLDSLKTIVAKQKQDTSEVMTLNFISGSYQWNDPDSAFYFAHRALSLAEKLQYDRGIFWSITSINQSLNTLGNYTLELDYAFRAYPLGKKLNDPYTIGFAHGMIGDVFFNLGEYDSCMRYYRFILELAERASLIDLGSLYCNLVPVLVSLHQYDSALFYARKGFALFKNNPSFNKGNYETTRYKCFGYRCLGEAFAGTADYDSALFYYHLSLPFTESLQNETNKIDVYNGIAKVHKEKNNLDSATWYAKRILTQRIINSYPVALLKATTTLADIYDLQHQSDSTLKYLRMAVSAKDMLFNHEKTAAIRNLFSKQREKEKDMAAAKMELQREYRMYFSIALLIILLIVAAILLKNTRQKQLQTMRNGIADDLHDDIGSALSSIGIMNELAKAKSPEATPLLTSIGESTQSIQENMSDIVWAIKSGNDRFENVVQRMTRFASEILEAKNMELDFKSDAALSASKLSMEQRKNVYLFFKEAVNNAAKYSDASKVSVWLTQAGRYAEMKIRDNGKGFDTTESFGGNGMNSLKKRATELKGDYKITSCPKDGTVVELRFKIT